MVYTENIAIYLLEVTLRQRPIDCIFKIAKRKVHEIKNTLTSIKCDRELIEELIQVVKNI